MKKQIILGLTALSILIGITACNENVSNSQGSVSDTDSLSVSDTDSLSVSDTDSLSEEISNTGNESISTESSVNITTENEPAEKVRGIYGETEIPDIPCGNKDFEGKAHELFNEEALKKCLDSMVFETHICGEYKISLVGDKVRTDKANFPGSIYTDRLKIEVEKNGTALGSEPDDATTGYYNNTATYVTQFYGEYRLFEDKIGSYLDMYELENPVIAMRYFYDDDPERTVKKAVEFATIQNDKVCTGFVGISEIGTGVCYNLHNDSGKFTNMLIVNTEDGIPCRMSIFAADEFKIVDSKTLCDEEANIKYTFEFSDPPKMELYTAEKM